MSQDLVLCLAGEQDSIQTMLVREGYWEADAIEDQKLSRVSHIAVNVNGSNDTWYYAPIEAFETKSETARREMLAKIDRRGIRKMVGLSASGIQKRNLVYTNEFFGFFHNSIETMSPVEE